MLNVERKCLNFGRTHRWLGELRNDSRHQRGVIQLHSVLLNHYNCIRFYWIICQNIDRFREAILNSDDFPPGFRPHACGGGGVLTWIIFFWDRENPRSIFDNCAIWFKYLFSFPVPLWSAPMDPFPNPHRARDTPYLHIIIYE